MDELLQQIERLAAANQALTQRLDREHSMRLAAEEQMRTILGDAYHAFARWGAEEDGIADDAWPVFETIAMVLAWPVGHSRGTRPAAPHVHDEIRDLRRRAHEAEAALEALRADVERDRTIDERDRALETIEEVAAILGCESEWTNCHDHHLCVVELASSSVASQAVASVCELLAAWGRAQDVEHCRESRRWAIHFHRNAKEAIERAGDALYGRR